MAAPVATEAQKFGKSMWANPVEHNDAEWLKGMKNHLKGQHHDQQGITINERMLKQQLSKTSNWTTPGPDGIQGFWIKNLTALHTRIAVQLNDIDESRGNIVNNYGPITCLPV